MATNACMQTKNLPPKVPRQGSWGLGLDFSNYGISKYLQVFHAAELARREPEITAYSVMPGVIATEMTDAAWVKVYCIGKSHCPMTIEEGAAVSTYAATAGTGFHPAPQWDKVKNGDYIVECHSAPSVRTAMRMLPTKREKGAIKYGEELYELSKQWSWNFKSNSTLMVV